MQKPCSGSPTLATADGLSFTSVDGDVELLGPETLPAYLRHRGIDVSEDVVVRELVGGVSNVVLLARWAGGRSS